MEVKAKLRNLRMAPRKTRAVADLVRGRKIGVALDQLAFSRKEAAKPLIKLLHSAVANAKNNFALTENNLYIKTITVDGGPTIKRWLPRAQGRATPINKRTSHLTVVLSEITPVKQAAAKTPTVAKSVKAEARPAEAEGLKVEPKSEPKPESKEQGKEIVDVRREGQGKHTKIEGGKRGFTTKVFRRKSG